MICKYIYIYYAIWYVYIYIYVCYCIYDWGWLALLHPCDFNQWRFEAGRIQENPCEMFRCHVWSSYVLYGFHERHLSSPLKDKTHGNSLVNHNICGSVWNTICFSDETLMLEPYQAVRCFRIFTVVGYTVGESSKEVPLNIRHIEASLVKGLPSDKLT